MAKYSFTYWCWTDRLGKLLKTLNLNNCHTLLSSSTIGSNPSKVLFINIYRVTNRRRRKYQFTEDDYHV